MAKKINAKAAKAPVASKVPLNKTEQEGKRRVFPILPLFFLMALGWGTWYYGDVFHVSREYSFWVADTRQLQFILSCSFGMLRYVGRALLMTYQYPLFGGLLLALMLTAGTWLVGYCMRLSAKWRPLQYLPAMGYMAVITYKGLDIFFEAEAGYILGIPFLALLVLSIWGIIIRSFSRKPVPAFVGVPKDETPRQNLVHLVVCVLCFASVVGFNEWKRPYVRVITQLMSLQYEQDWSKIQDVARAHAIQSNRPMACYYAIALVQTGKIAERMYDIRLDYDTLWIHGMDGYHNNATNLYIPEGCYHGGFIEPCMHSCMEQMVMTGPTLRNLKLLTKCALMRDEWELARKYLRILRDVPFEGEFCKKYSAMVERPELVNADKEMATIRLTEPIHDSFESQYQQPVFMGYNLALVEGRSIQALTNSLCVCLYTKVMPLFMERLTPIYGTSPQEIIADGILLASTKQPGLQDQFQNLQLRVPSFQSFISNVEPYMTDRPGHAYELFDKYKGYYPYYYYFGNLKATKKGYTGVQTSNSGVN